MNDPDTITIKVTAKDGHAYFVRFDRASHVLVDVFEYRKIHSPLWGTMSKPMMNIVSIARTGIVPDKTPVTAGEPT